MLVSNISKPEYPFLTIRQTLVRDAEKHRLRGEKYLKAGNHECAEGSFIKSFKKRRKAKALVWDF